MEVPADIELHFRWPPSGERRGPKSLTPAQLMLVLLKVGPVAGRTMMQKQMFLAYNEVFEREAVMDPEFRADYFGPYSPLVADLPYLLRSEGKVVISARGEGHSTYNLGRRGRDEAGYLASRKVARRQWNRLTEMKRSWDEFTTQGILRYVYRNYPEFTTKTKVPYLKWE